MRLHDCTIVFCTRCTSCGLDVQKLRKEISCATFAQVRTFFGQCTRFAQDCTYFPNVQYRCKICTRLYFFLQCAVYAQDLCKICARLFSFLNGQYMCKIVLLSPMRYALSPLLTQEINIII